MRDKYIKCEFRRWLTSPTFYGVIFAVVYFLIFGQEMMYYHDDPMSWFAYPVLIVLGGSICAIYWAVEKAHGCTRTVLSMPVTRREYLASKFVAVMLGQVYFTILVLLCPILVFLCSILPFPVAPEDTIILYSPLYVIALAGFASAITFYFTLQGRTLTGVLFSGVLVGVYHLIYNFTVKGAPEGLLMQLPLFSIVLMVFGLTVIIAVVAWRVTFRYFSFVKDVS